MPINLPASITRGHRVVIVLLAFAAYAPVLQLGFLWDDHVMIESNPALRHWSWAALRKDFMTDPFCGRGDPYYRPAQVIANRVDYSLWGLRPFGYHLTNLIIHVANALLSVEFVLALGIAPLAALMTGCFLAVHPIVVEQLMIIAGRAEIFGLFWTLLALLCLFKRSRLSAAAAAGPFFIGLLFKESVIITPLLAILSFYGRGERPWRYARILTLAPVIPIYLWLRHQAVGSPFQNVDLPLAAQFASMAFPNVLLRYAGLILLPWNLHSHRLMPHLTVAWPALLAGLLALVIWLARRRQRTGLFCLGWFVLCLLPKAPIMMAGHFRLDHWAYPAAIGPFLILALFFKSQWERYPHRLHGALALLFFPLLIIWALLARLNIELRGTDEKMYRWALHFTTTRPIQRNLGVLLVEEGRAREALPYLENVRAAYPEDSDNTFVLAKAYFEAGHPAIARLLLESLAANHPPYEPAVRVLSLMKRP